MDDIQTTRDIAERIGADSSTVRRIAVRLGLGRRLGGGRIYTPAEAERISAEFRGAAGNPNFVPGNKLGGRRKKSENNR